MSSSEAESAGSGDEERSKKRAHTSSKSDTKKEKKSKKEAKARESSPETDNSSPESDGKKDSKKELSVDLGRNRLVTLNEFRGRISVDIREHYEKDGKKLPGKKGISLSTDEWKKLKKSVSQVDAALEKRLA